MLWSAPLNGSKNTAMPSVEKRVSDGEPPLAVVAALKRELVPLGRKAHPNLALIETGAGAQNADRHLRWWLERSRTSGVIGIGFAGALSLEPPAKMTVGIL